jgi:hypothetical protein
VSAEAARFHEAAELFDVAERMLEMKLRRERPDITEEELDDAVSKWLKRRPGAELGDAEGRPIAWPRKS